MQTIHHFIHGWMGDGRDWREVMDHLGAASRALDLPGHGGGKSDADVPSFDDLIQHLARDISGPVHLVGYSMGGRIAMHLAKRFPDKVATLTMISASPGIESECDRARRREDDAAWAAKLRSMPVRDFLVAWYQQPVFASLANKPDMLTAIMQRRQQRDPERLAAALVTWGQGTVPSLWGASLSTPVQWIFGAEDTKYVALAERIRAERREPVVIVPGAGHTVHLEQPAAVADSIRIFIEEHNS